MTAQKRRNPRDDADEIAAYARENVTCPTCGAEPGERCRLRGVYVHKARFAAAATALARQRKTGRRTAEQEAILATLPAVPLADIEACRTERGGYSFTKKWFLAHGLPYPPIPGWREAVERKAKEANKQEALW